MPPIKIDTPQGPIWLDPVTGDIVGDPSGVSGTPTSGNPYENYPPHGGLAGQSQVGAPSALGTTSADAAAPTGQKRVINVTNLGGGRYQYEFSDGTFQIGDSAGLAGESAAASGSGGGGGMTANQQAGLTEDQRQFDLTQGERKARGDQQQRLAEAQFAEEQRQFGLNQDLSRGNTLLGLGSRPDTLIKYLYALQGQQTPQGIQNTTSNLPGYQNVIGKTNYGAGTAMGAPIGTGTAPIAAPVTPANYPVAPGGTNITATDPRLSAAPPLAAPPLQAGVAPTATQGATNEQLGAQDALVAGGRKPKFYSNGVAIFKHGGPIPEHVIGVGLKSGKTYEFGEKGPEFVIPNNKVKDLMSLLGKGMKDGETDAMGNKSYATGGAITYNTPTTADKAMIGGVETWAGGPYSGQAVASTPANAGDLTPFLSNPSLGAQPRPAVAPTSALSPAMPRAAGAVNYSQTPTLGQNSSGFFNDPNLRNVVSRGYNSNPGVPLFPQIGLATNQGSSLVPSAQRLNALLPSEQSLYAGALQDEFGANPEDVFQMARKLAPQVAGLRTPRYSN